MNLLHVLRPQSHVASSVMAVILATAIHVHCAASGAAAAGTLATTPLDRVVQDACNKRVVLLGEEGHHAGGNTLAVKTTLVTRLIDECGFSAVVFEASLAEFVDLNRAFAAGRASPEYVADAIGGLWSVAGESDPLISALFVRALRRHVVLAGLDGQIGSTNLYAQSGLAAELTAYLADARRLTCQAELQRFARYQYDATSPFDDATRVRLRECLTEIKTAAAGPVRSTTADEAAAMATAWQNAIEIAAPALSRSAAFNARDRAMYQALQWHIAHLPRNSKIIVWCATIHAAKSLRRVPGFAEFVPLGSYVNRDFGDAATAIGVSALAGRYGRGKAPATELVPAPAGSLEARAFSGEGSNDEGYFGRADLVRFGSLTGHPLDYSQPVAAPWHEVIDGLLVQREEHPLTVVHDAKPRRTGSIAR